MPEDSENTIHLVVKSNDQEEIHFRIKRDVPLKKLIDKYCMRIGITNQNSVNFIYDDKKIGINQTANKLKMEDMDVIYVVVPQVGGENGRNR